MAEVASPEPRETAASHARWSAHTRRSAGEAVLPWFAVTRLARASRMSISATIRSPGWMNNPREISVDWLAGAQLGLGASGPISGKASVIARQPPSGAYQVRKSAIVTSAEVLIASVIAFLDIAENLDHFWARPLGRALFAARLNAPGGLPAGHTAR